MAGILFRNKFWWNFNRSPYIFIQENAIENVVCKMAAILTNAIEGFPSVLLNLVAAHLIQSDQSPCGKSQHCQNTISIFILLINQAINISHSAPALNGVAYPMIKFIHKWAIPCFLTWISMGLYFHIYVYLVQPQVWPCTNRRLTNWTHSGPISHKWFEPIIHSS